MATLVIYAGNGQVVAPGFPSDPLQVELTNGGLPVVGATITWAISSGPGTLSGATSTTNSSGIAHIHFSGDLFITIAESYKTSRVTASAAGASNVSFYATTTTRSTGGFAVFPTTTLVKPSTSIGLVGNPSGTLTDAVQVLVKAASGTDIGHGIPHVGVWMDGGNPFVYPTARLSGGTELTGTDGLTANVTLGAVAGGPVDMTLYIGGFAQYDIPINVSADASQTVPRQGNYQHAYPGTAFDSPIYVEVRQADGDPSVGTAVVWAVVTPGSLTIDTSELTTDSRGWAAATVTAGATPGDYTITATAGGDTATFNLIILDPAAVQFVDVYSGNGQTAVAGAAFAEPLVAMVTDGAAQPVSGVVVNFTVASGSVSVNPAADVTDANGWASTVVTAGSFSGTARVRASISGDGAMFTLYVTGGGTGGGAGGGGTGGGVYVGSSSGTASLRFRGLLTVTLTSPAAGGGGAPVPAPDYTAYPTCLASYDKNPSDVLDLSIDWTDWLDGDTLTGSTWDDGGLTVVTSSYTATESTVRVSGGADGSEYWLENTITTSAGRTEVKTLRVVVSEASGGPGIQSGWTTGSPS
jgi:hypothetical protein